MDTDARIRQLALAIIGRIAPEADTGRLDPAARLRDQFEFDSVDFMNFASALQEELNIAIPEQDYPRLATLDSCVAYVTSRLPPR